MRRLELQRTQSKWSSNRILAADELSKSIPFYHAFFIDESTLSNNVSNDRNSEHIAVSGTFHTSCFTILQYSTLQEDPARVMHRG